MAFSRILRYLFVTLCVTSPALALPATEPLNVPERIVSISPAATELIYALGAESHLVGVTLHCTYPPQARELPKVGGFHEISVETVLSLEPDLVLAADMQRNSVVPFLRARGVTVEVIDPQTLDELYGTITTMGDLVDRSTRARRLIRDIRDGILRIEDLVAGKPTRKVLYLISEDLWAAGKGSYLDDLITRAGGRNIARSGPWIQISSELVLLEDPEIIFLVAHGNGNSDRSRTGSSATPENHSVNAARRLSGLPGWRNLSAIRNNRIIPIRDEDLVSRIGPRVAETLELLAREIHPDAFK